MTMVKVLIGNLLLALVCQEMKIALDVPAAAPGVALGSGAGRDSDLTLPPVMHRRDHLRLFRSMELLLLPPLLVLQTLTFLRDPLIRVRSYGRKTFGDAVAPRSGLKEAPLYGDEAEEGEEEEEFDPDPFATDTGCDEREQQEAAEEEEEGDFHTTGELGEVSSGELSPASWPTPDSDDGDFGFGLQTKD
ncbi:unnamed protein product [Symbiodinium sp. KB8]|nr:unnamed protein product [Symbiodinium sp. KB8]